MGVKSIEIKEHTHMEEDERYWSHYGKKCVTQ